jgi:anti-sigma factor RsiW
MTDCPNGDIRDQLPDYVHDRLNAADRARVAAHVASCPSCAVEIKLLDTARRVLTAAAPSIDTARIVATLPSPPRAVPRPAIVRSARGVELGVEPGVERGIEPRRPAFRVTSWRIAAAFATVAIAGASMVVIRGMTGVPASPSVTSPVAVAPPPAVVAPAPVTQRPVSPQPTPQVHQEMVLADNNVALPDGGRIGELSDDDVQSLLDDIDHLDGVPDENPQPAVPALHTGGTL